MKANRDWQKTNYEDEKKSIAEFLQTFTDPDLEADPQFGRSAYLIQLKQIADRDRNLLEVYLEDLESFFTRAEDSKLIESIRNNSKRYQRMFMDVVDSLLPTSIRDFPKTVQDVILEQRLTNDSRNKLPSDIIRRYDLIICHRPGLKFSILPLRQVDSRSVGHLISVKGVVTRAAEVKPHMAVASFVCDVCGHEEFKTVGGLTYLPLIECTSEACRASNSRGNLHHQTRGSKFVSFQEIRIQEPSDQVPMGQVPRSMKIFAFGNATRQCTPGDLITITGPLLTMPYMGFRAVTAGLVHDTHVEAFKIIREKKSYKDTSLSAEMVERIHNERQGQDMYTRLSRSIAPEIHGLEDVKKALLLLLVGGVSKEMSDGMKIRGDINLLLMGDPGVAKSQLLKHISVLAPRGIYTTGKGSSGVGLTAAVLKDTITGEMTLEGGALVLADQGICCIDEFDKMDERDRTSIHEVMEQQSVSIAKAGITTTLNARTSILAAANPLYGRYDRKKTPHENINLPAALLSRFDLVFLLLDVPDHQADLSLAEAVTFVHQNLKAKERDHTVPLDAHFMRAYIAEAKRMEPVIPSGLHNFIIQKYVEKRLEQTDISKVGYVYVTPRTLLGIIRLAQGLARLRFSETVDQDDIEEALRLMESSRASVNLDSTNTKRTDPISTIFKIIRDECKKDAGLTSDIASIERRVLAKGYSQDELKECLNTYANLNILMLSDSGNLVTLIN